MKNRSILKCAIIAVVMALCLTGCEQKNGHDYDKIDKELAELCKRIDKNPTDAQSYYLRASYYYQHKMIDNALDDIRNAVKLNQNNAQFYILFADLYFSQHETDLAEEALQKAIALDPNNNEAYLKLSELYYLLGMFNECNKTLDEAIQLQNHNPKAHLIRASCLKETGDTIGFVRMLQLVIDQDPKEIKAFLELGYYYQQKLNPIAANYYQNALQVEPNNKNINYNLAQLYNDLGEIDNAIEQYKILLNIDPNYIPALHNLGYIYLVKADRYDDAIQLFTKVLEIDSTFISAVTNRGIAFEQKKEYGYARQDYSYARQLEPTSQAAINGLNRLDKIGK